ncbi:hypothetical protein Pelo_9128 [Pelomyxa schiedti]|nr:hypothetical protein Pelo_9128 [Pelomyxa schiedti]
MSRIVWEHVVVPWVLPPVEVNDCYGYPADWLPPPSAVSCVLATAEAMFPLVALASRAALLLQSKCHCASRRYPAIEAAAGALSPRCVAWLILRNSRGGNSPPALPGLSSTTGGGGGGGDYGTMEIERDRRRRRKGKEQVAVLGGLCAAGHLRMAQRFVENGCECWESDGGGGGSDTPPPKAWALWQSSGGVSVTCDSVTGRRSSDSAIGVTAHDELGCLSILDWSRAGKNGSAGYDEFWGKRGLFHIIEEVSRNGHLEVLKWLVPNCVKEINKGNKMVLFGCLRKAFQNGNLHILKWLVDTFDLGDVVSGMELASSFQPMKGRVSDVKLFVETFPHWDFSEPQDLADSAALCKGSSADETIEVCKWLKDRFSLKGSAFFSRLLVLGREAKVIQWAALSDGCSGDTLEGPWRRVCAETGDIEFGKWVVGRGVAATANNFMAACAGSHDSVEFLKWLFQKVGGDLSPGDLVEALHRALAVRNHCIARWLEQHITTTTGARPQVLLSKLLWRDVPTQEDWFEWVLTHSRHCDIDCSPAEVLSAVKASVKGEFTVKTKISRAVSICKRFPLSPAVEHHDVLVMLLKKVVEVGSFHEFQEVMSFGDFTVDDMKNCFDYNHPRSSKMTKWRFSKEQKSPPANLSLDAFPKQTGVRRVAVSQPEIPSPCSDI